MASKGQKKGLLIGSATAMVLLVVLLWWLLSKPAETSLPTVAVQAPSPTEALPPALQEQQALQGAALRDARAALAAPDPERGFEIQRTRAAGEWRLEVQRLVQGCLPVPLGSNVRPVAFTLAHDQMKSSSLAQHFAVKHIDTAGAGVPIPPEITNCLQRAYSTSVVIAIQPEEIPEEPSQFVEMIPLPLFAVERPTEEGDDDGEPTVPDDPNGPGALDHGR